MVFAPGNPVVKRKTFTLPAVIMLFILVPAFFSCENNQYKEIVRFMNMRAEAGEKFAVRINQASTKDQVIKALENLEKDAVRLYYELNRINEKNQEGIEIRNPPPEYLAAKERLDKMSAGLEKAFEKLQIYSGDPDVQEAITNIFSIPVFE